MFRGSTLTVSTIDLFELPGRLVDMGVLWYERARQRHDLAHLDARALADIGLSRKQALSEARKPFWRV